MFNFALHICSIPALSKLKTAQAYTHNYLHIAHRQAKKNIYVIYMHIYNIKGTIVLRKQNIP